MQRDLLLISEMIAAAEQAQSLVADADLDALGDDRHPILPDEAFTAATARIR